MLTKYKLQDYKVSKLIGKGSFGQILLVNRANQQFAMKKISKKQIIKVNKLHEPFIQRQILFKFRQIAPEAFVNLYQTHSDNDYIYMIMEYCNGGSMDSIINHLNQIQNKSEVIKRIIIKMTLILEIMHKNGVIHRDLKPSNFLFKQDGTLKIADFGTAYAQETFFSPEIAKQIMKYKQMSKKRQSQKMSEADKDQSTAQSTTTRRATFVGTPLYMAPQLLEEDFCGPQSDLWALGCIIYELMHLKPPFYDQNQGMVWKKILSDNYNEAIKINETKQLAHYESLIKSLLVKDRSKRLGFGQNGYEALKKHPFFEGVDWQSEVNKPIKEIALFFQKNKNKMEKQVPQKGEQRIIFSGAVGKKMFFGNFKQRMLVLHSTPKLVYFDMDTGEQKGQILLTKDTPITTEGQKVFLVTTSKKAYIFKSIKAPQWVQMIKYAIINAFY